MKPIGLFAYQIGNNTHEGDAVLDLFGGSGTTLMACEQLNRKCYMCELDEHYCDVIIQRWEDFTGQKAVLLNE
jgi:site-specific DNA-methyltransferase (adenine-specific)